MRLELQFIAGKRPWETLTFDNCRAARSYLLQTVKQEGARREGTGAEGKLVRGKGSSKRCVALYRIFEV